MRIRANQGHSIEVDLGLAPVQPPDVLHHGTASRFLPSILAAGLDKRERHHAHLTTSLDIARSVGQLLDIDAATMFADGHVFFRSDNGVWLTDSVPPRYLKLRS
jgi:putative RNA 2'-phosphotransferase